MCHPANVKHLHWTPTPRGGGVTCCLHVCLRICSSEACVSPAFFSTLNSPLAVFHSSGLRGKLLLSSPFCLGRGGGRQGEAGPQQPQSADQVGMQKRDLNRRSRGKNRVRRFFFFFLLPGHSVPPEVLVPFFPASSVLLLFRSPQHLYFSEICPFLFLYLR